jgi:hypothetical protein
MGSPGIGGGLFRLFFWVLIAAACAPAPHIPRCYDSNFDAWGSALTGPIPGGRAFNVHEWELR